MVSKTNFKEVGKTRDQKTKGPGENRI